MIKYRISEIIYLIISILSIKETYLLWGLNQKKAYLFLIFFFVSICMFLFRRSIRKKMNKDS